MKKMDYIRAALELCITILLLWLFPFNFERKVKLFLLYVFCQVIVGRYQNKSQLVFEEMHRVVLGYGGFLFTAILTVAFRSPTALLEIGYILGFTFLDFLSTCFLLRYAHLWFFNKVKRNVVVVGAGKTARRLDNVVRANRFSTMDIKAFVDCTDDPAMPSACQTVVEQRAPIISSKDLDNYLDTHEIDAVMVAIPEMNAQDMEKLTRRLADKVENVKYIPQTEGMVTFASRVEDFDGLLMISTAQPKITWWGRFCKRAFDIAGGLVGCLVVLPLSLYVMILNRKNGDRGKIFFTQDRIGKDGKLFKVYKFRTMVPNAEEVLNKMLAENPEMAEEYRVNKKLQNDPRITKAGHFLRGKSLDEFPQFFNVLKGDMSLVGPRPYLPREKEDMKDYYDSIISCAPGVTGMWQTHGRSAVSFEQRLVLDEFYYRNWSLWLDLTIFIKTLQNLYYGDDNAV